MMWVKLLHSAGEARPAGIGPGRGASEWRPADGQDRQRKRAGTHTHSARTHYQSSPGSVTCCQCYLMITQICLCSLSTCKWYPDLCSCLLLCLPPPNIMTAVTNLSMEGTYDPHKICICKRNLTELKSRFMVYIGALCVSLDARSGVFLCTYLPSKIPTKYLVWIECVGYCIVRWSCIIMQVGSLPAWSNSLYPIFMYQSQNSLLNALPEPKCTSCQMSHVFRLWSSLLRFRAVTASREQIQFLFFNFSILASRFSSFPSSPMKLLMEAFWAKIQIRYILKECCLFMLDSCWFWISLVKITAQILQPQMRGLHANEC